MASRFDLGHVIRHPVFLVTYAIGIPAWIIAFAGQCAAEARYSNADGTPVVKYLWYSIWIQLAIIIHLLLALGHDTLAIHRFQLAIFLAIAEVFAVYGTEFIFFNQPALITVGVGWLLTAMVDLVWIFYLTSEEGSFFYRILNGGGTGGLSGYSRGGVRKDSGIYGAEGAIGSGVGSGLGGGVGGGGIGGGVPSRYGGSATRINGAHSPNYAPPVDTTPQKVGLMSGMASAQSPLASEDHAQTAQSQRARAMYAYQADPTDPNEISFSKGDVLDVLDNSGKWWQCRTPSGQTGIAPSNYLTML